MDSSGWSPPPPSASSTSSTSSSSSWEAAAATVAAVTVGKAANGSFSGEDVGSGDDRMVRIELEAAEALAGLAHWAMRESETWGSESGGKWGRKGKRASSRVKNQSPAADSGSSWNWSAPRNSDLAEQDGAVVYQQQRKRMCGSVIINSVKAEQDIELPKSISTCTTNYTLLGGGRLRQNLTEAEKEARRLRRVLANRESARQTIRRRQALCEELTRKAADLAWENESLKRDKGLAVKEYESLKIKNKHLKAQVAKTINSELEEVPGVFNSSQPELSTSPSANFSMLSCNQSPFTPFLCPSVIQSSKVASSQHRPQNAVSVLSEVPSTVTVKRDLSYEQESSLHTNYPRTPLYIIPCPWFFPLPEFRSRLHIQPSYGVKDKQEETSANNQHSASFSSSKAAAHIKGLCSSFPMNSEAETSSLTEAIPTNNLQETTFRYASDGGGLHMIPHPEGMVIMPASISSFRPPVAVKHENGILQEHSQNAAAISSPASHIINALPERNQETSIHQGKKLADAIAAAKARKKRKELTKLKNLYGRRCRMNC